MIEDVKSYNSDRAIVSLMKNSTSINVDSITQVVTLRHLDYRNYEYIFFAQKFHQ